MNLPVDRDPWARLRPFTPARIGLGRAGAAIATADQLAFQLAHAEARDAVHAPFDAAALAAEVAKRRLGVLHLTSAAPDKSSYLASPDLGRRLNDASRLRLAELACDFACDLAVVVTDGLSALAVHRHALPLLDALTRRLNGDLKIGTVAVVERGRVAIGDEIGAGLNAALVAVLIGERPGLSSPDSLGVYLTWAPKVGRKDADRNCISNIRPQGLGYEAAAEKLAYLVGEAQRRRLTGVKLKDETGAALLA
ncbi:MAG: ethanolamine ammonia-lyase subunit EutC [Rhodospirillaceae bacterium]